MKPTVGRIVIYRTLSGVDCAAIVIATPDSAISEPPADGHVQLKVFWPASVAPDYIDAGGVPECPSPGDELARGTWRWPERV